MDALAQGLHAWGSAHVGAAWPYLFTFVKTLVLIVAIVLPLMGAVAYTTLYERKFIGAMQVRSGNPYIFKLAHARSAKATQAQGKTGAARS